MLSGGPRKGEACSKHSLLATRVALGLQPSCVPAPLKGPLSSLRPELGSCLEIMKAQSWGRPFTAYSLPQEEKREPKALMKKTTTTMMMGSGQEQAAPEAGAAATGLSSVSHGDSHG